MRARSCCVSARVALHVRVSVCAAVEPASWTACAPVGPLSPRWTALATGYSGPTARERSNRA